MSVCCADERSEFGVIVVAMCRSGCEFLNQMMREMDRYEQWVYWLCTVVGARCLCACFTMMIGDWF